MKHIMAYLILFVGVVSVSACSSVSSSKILDRQKAKELLEASPKFKNEQDSAEIFIPAQALQAGLDLGYWQPDQKSFNGVYSFTDKGKQYFTPNAMRAAPINSADWYFRTQRKLLRRLRQITGILTNGNLAEVKYEWTWDVSFLPSDLRKVLENSPGEKATAEFVLYDDGWRIE
jgi:hypothetical protein